MKCDTVGRHVEDGRFAPQADFVELVVAAHDEGSFAAESVQGSRQFLGGAHAVRSEQLKLSSGRICQRAEQVEDRPNSERFPHRHNILHGRMQEWSEAESNPDFVDALPYLFRRDLQVDSQRGQDVGRAARTRHAPVPVLSDRDACPGRHDRRRRADVKRVQRVASCSTRVDKSCCLAGNFRRPLPHDGRDGGDLLKRLAFDGEPREQGGDVDLCCVAVHDRCESRSHFRSRHGLPSQNKFHRRVNRSVHLEVREVRAKVCRQISMGILPREIPV